MQPLSLQAPPAYSTHPSLPSSSRFLAIIVISSSGSLPPFIRIPHGVGVRVLIPSSELSWGREGKGGEGEGRGRRLLSFAFLSLSLSLPSVPFPRISNGDPSIISPSSFPRGWDARQQQRALPRTTFPREWVETH